MRVRRKDNGVEWDIHPSYYDKYQSDFEVVNMVVEDAIIPEIVVPEPPVKNKGGRPPKEKGK